MIISEQNATGHGEISLIASGSVALHQLPGTGECFVAGVEAAGCQDSVARVEVDPNAARRQARGAFDDSARLSAAVALRQSFVRNAVETINP